MTSVPRLLFADGQDPRVQEAALRVGAEGFATPVVVGDFERIGIVGERLGLDPDAVDVIGPRPARVLVQRYRRRHDGASSSVAQLLDRPSGHGAALVAAGEADALIAGPGSSISEVVAACDHVFGLAAGARLASSWLLVRASQRRMFVFADCVMNPDPTPRELAAIALQTARSVAERLEWVPRVAMLSFSTHGSVDHPAAHKVRQAAELVRAGDPRLIVDGELQAGVALDQAFAAPAVDDHNAVAVRANVLVFPNLDAGAIAHELVRALSETSSLGAFLEGYTWPAIGLSRSVTVDDIVEAAAIVANGTRAAIALAS